MEISDDPLDKMTTAEAIRTLTEFYRQSKYCSQARKKVEEISSVVSNTECRFFCFFT